MIYPQNSNLLPPGAASKLGQNKKIVVFRYNNQKKYGRSVGNSFYFEYFFQLKSTKLYTRI